MSEGINLYGNKMLLKDALQERLKSYRNFSVKFALLLFSLCFAAHFTYTVSQIDYLALRLDESLYSSSVFSLIFGVVGYCSGSVFGSFLQKQQLDHVAETRLRKKQLLEQQIAIRKAKLEAFN